MAGAYDVIVVGVGGMGSAAAYQLAARCSSRQRVLGIEQFTPAHDRGSSHGRSRIIRLAYHEHPSYVPLVRRAYELWREAEAESGRPLLTVTGGIMLSTPEGDLVSGARRSADLWGLPYELLDAAEVRARFPALTPADPVTGLYEPGTGFVRPEEAVRAYTGLAAAAGADLRYGERVTGWSASAAGVSVSTTAGTYSGGRLVFCAGPWSPGLLADLGVPMAVERQVMHWFEPTAGIGLFAPGRHPIYLWGETDDDLLYGFPAQDGETAVKAAFYRRPARSAEAPAKRASQRGAGGGSQHREERSGVRFGGAGKRPVEAPAKRASQRSEERSGGGAGEHCTPDDIDRRVHPAEVAEIRAFMAPRIPAAAGRHVVSKTCMYTTTPDRAFVVGHHPGQENVVVACGFSGHGFKFVPVIGEILADLATTGRTGHHIGLFDPARFG